METKNLRIKTEKQNDVGTKAKKRIRRIGNWSSDELVKLISLFEERRTLWDTTMKEYRNRARRKEALQDIANMLNKERCEIEAQWNNLRGQHRHAKSKLANFKTGKGGKQVSISFPYFVQMSFLNSIKTDTSRRISNFNDDDDDSSSLCEENFSSATMSPLPSENTQQSLDEKSIMLTNTYQVMEAMDERPSNQALRATDAFDSFGSSVAALLRELDIKLPIVRHELQVNIQEAILNAQKKLYEHLLSVSSFNK